jgi:hypothetical protein
MLMMRNIRIQRGARLNPSCAIERRFESMLRTDTPQNLFQQPVRSEPGGSLCRNNDSLKVAGSFRTGHSEKARMTAVGSK